MMFAAKLVVFAIAVLTVSADSLAPLDIIRNLNLHVRQDVLGNCTETEVLDYLNTFANVKECSTPDFLFNTTFCKDECHEIYFGLGKYCNDETITKAYRLNCGEFNNRYCADVIVDGATTTFVVNAVQKCGENDTVSCSADCTSALEDIGNNVGCCFNNLYNVTASGGLVITTYKLWKACDVETPGLCLVPEPTPPPPPTKTPETDGTATTDNGGISVESSLLFITVAFIMTLYGTNAF